MEFYNEYAIFIRLYLNIIIWFNHKIEIGNEEAK